jgi:hypothetical protein
MTAFVCGATFGLSLLAVLARVGPIRDNVFFRLVVSSLLNVKPN